MLFPLLVHKSETVYLLLSESHHHLTPSNVTSQLTTLSRCYSLWFKFFNFDVLANLYITLHVSAEVNQLCVTFYMFLHELQVISVYFCSFICSKSVTVVHRSSVPISFICIGSYCRIRNTGCFSAFCNTLKTHFYSWVHNLSHTHHSDFSLKLTSWCSLNQWPNYRNINGFSLDHTFIIISSRLTGMIPCDLSYDCRKLITKSYPKVIVICFCSYVSCS